MACVHLITYLSRCTTRACSTDLVRPTHLPGRVHRSLSRYAVVMSRLVTQVGHRVFVAVSRARMWVLQLYAPATGYLFVMATPFLRLLKLPAGISSQSVQAEGVPCCIQCLVCPQCVGRWLPAGGVDGHTGLHDILRHARVHLHSPLKVESLLQGCVCT